MSPTATMPETYAPDPKVLAHQREVFQAKADYQRLRRELEVARGRLRYAEDDDTVASQPEDLLARLANVAELRASVERIEGELTAAAHRIQGSDAHEVDQQIREEIGRARLHFAARYGPAAERLLRLLEETTTALAEVDALRLEAQAARRSIDGNLHDQLGLPSPGARLRGVLHRYRPSEPRPWDDWAAALRRAGVPISPDFQ